MGDNNGTSGQPGLHPLFNTRILMIASALFTGILGFAASFLPEEIIGYFGATPGPMGVLLMKVAGALYLGFAVLNWMARGNIIGGIYSRPVSAGNFLHFFVVALVLLKSVPDTARPAMIGVVAAINALFAAGFGYLLFGGGDDAAEGAACG